MAISTRASKNRLWILLGVFGLAGGQSAACSAPFHSCYETRTCAGSPGGEAGAAGEEAGGATGGAVQPKAGSSGLGRGGDGDRSGESGAGGAQENQGGEAGATQEQTTCATGEYQKAAPTSTSDRGCVPWSDCSAGTFVSTQPSSTVDRACSPCAAGKFSNVVNAAQCTAWNQCSAGETESVAPSATSDRVCSKCGTGKYESGGQCRPLTACTAAQYESTPATATSDRKCSALTACTAEQYESTPATAVSDRKCSALTNCQPGSAQTAAPTATSDRKCAPCSAGQFSTQVNSTCKAWSVCSAIQNQSMAGTATTDVVCVDKPGFLNGPCVTSTGGTGVEVFARGDDKKIYRRAIDGNALGSWAVLAGLDGNAIDGRSDLDCAGTADSIHIVAVGNNPQGAFLSAVGSGTTYGAFTRALAPQLFLPSASVARSPIGNYWLGGLTASSVYAEGSNVWDGSQVTPRVPNNLQNLPWSGLDSAYMEGASVSWYYLAAFDSTAQLAVYILQQTQGGPAWLTPRLLPPPTGKQYQGSPTICTWSAGISGDKVVHLAATAGGQLWHAHSDGGEAPFSAWELTNAQVAATSAPDCATTPDGAVHIVALDGATAGVVKISGSSGAFTTQHLGGH